MATLNRVYLIGNLTRDPEVRTTPSGTCICRLGLAVTRQFRNADGSSREEVLFIEVDSFGRQAETIARYVTKGRPILIEGRLRLDQWESQNGEKRSRIMVVAENFQFLTAPNRQQEGGEGNYVREDGGQRWSQQQQQQRRSGRPRPEGEESAEEEEEGDEEIPF
ncbi:MAG: single-stranded DNA-binding protein [Puniceicoccales bacterium]|jgi:single-strand DNA-binding protein|nr:single-stranded DNA-binding protein [Puniceicoccales bacterium]